jgi:RNA polymerase-binding transcription factor DksA
MSNTLQQKALVDVDNSNNSPIIESIKEALQLVNYELAKGHDHYDSGSSGDEKATELRVADRTRFYDPKNLLQRKANVETRLNNPVVHCTKCGRKIEEQRLVIVPETENCLTCAKQQTVSSGFQNQRKSYAHSQR